MRALLHRLSWRASCWAPWVLAWAVGLLPGAARAAEDTASWFSPLLVGELDYRVHSAEVEGETGFALGRFRLGLHARPNAWLHAWPRASDGRGRRGLGAALARHGRQPEHAPRAPAHRARLGRRVGGLLDGARPPSG